VVWESWDSQDSDSVVVEEESMRGRFAICSLDGMLSAGRVRCLWLVGVNSGSGLRAEAGSRPGRDEKDSSRTTIDGPLGGIGKSWMCWWGLWEELEGEEEVGERD
jgi:hypothetical protein